MDANTGSSHDHGGPNLVTSAKYDHDYDHGSDDGHGPARTASASATVGHGPSHGLSHGPGAVSAASHGEGTAGMSEATRTMLSVMREVTSLATSPHPSSLRTGSNPGPSHGQGVSAHSQASVAAGP
eukprot:437850-Rhodomonas_salina.1